ncbi:MAG: CRISPR-associated protein Cas5 [Candidatus Aenigmatarchaeota archaeon]
MVNSSGLVIKISFFEAFFKCHYTKKYRLSYPIPLPTTIAGIIGSILGLKRESLKEFFSNFYLGAKLIKGDFNFEFSTLLELERGATTRVVEKFSLINNPEYEIAIFGEENKIRKIKEVIKELKFHFLPFGGQNDYFLKNIELVGEEKVEEKNIAYGYFPISIVKNLKGKFWILPVKYKNASGFKKENFVFSLEEVELITNIKTVNNIAVYPFSNFNLL